MQPSPGRGRITKLQRGQVWRTMQAESPMLFEIWMPHWGQINSAKKDVSMMRLMLLSN